MSEPVVKQRPTLDLDDFERRLRHASTSANASARDDDPLAELARLVGEPYDPFDDVFAHEAMSTQPGHSHVGAAQIGQSQIAHGAHDQLGGYGQHAGHDAMYAAHERREPGFASEAAAPRLFGDFAAIEAGLRGSVPHGDPSDAQAYYDQNLQAHAHQGLAHQGDALYEDQPNGYGQQEWAEHPVQPPASRMRRPVYLMAATIAVGVIGIGAAFALKGRVATSPGEVKTILADAGPTKIQPPPDASADASSNDPNAFGRGNQTAPTRVVSREEQPVDIAQAVQDNAARASIMPTSPLASMSTDASSVPVPPSPGQMKTAMADPQARPAGRQDTIGEQVQSFGLSDMPAPKRVRVVSVRPDGTILPNDQPPAAAIPAPRAAPAKTSDHVAPVAKASTPKIAATKTTTRVTATPKSIEQIASGDDAAPAAKPAKKVKPQRVASAESTPSAGARDTEPTAAIPSEGGGGFAVQLAAPGSEADAKSTSSRLAKKFADALAGHRLGFHKAESNGKSVYRVRVGSLSRSDAVSLCEKLKADGGTCFVAKN